MRQGGEELGLEAVGFGQVGRHAPQRGLGPAPFGNIGEQHRDPAPLGRSQPGRVHVVPAVQALSLVLEAHRLAGLRHLPIDVEPVLLVGWHHLADRLAHRVDQTGVLDEGRIGLDEQVVAGLAFAVVDHVDHAQALVDRVEHGVVALLGGAQLLFGLALARGVHHHPVHLVRRAMAVVLDVAARDHPAPAAGGRADAVGGGIGAFAVDRRID